MAVAGTHKASVYSGTNLTSYATGSWTPTADTWAICSVQNELSGTPTTPTVSGNGVTWSTDPNLTYINDTAGTQSRITIFVAKMGASPSAGAVTADFAAVEQAGCNIIVDEFTGVDVSGTSLNAVVQSKTGTVNGSGTSESITLDSGITAGNASFGAFHHQAAEGNTAGDSHTELGDGNHAGPSSSFTTVYKPAGNQTVSASWTTSIAKGGIALEIKAAGAAAAAKPKTLLTLGVG
jgi:hypothetical protein